MGTPSLSLASRLKRAVKKMSLILLGFKLNRWRLASIIGCASRASARKCLSFNDRLGLYSCIDDEKPDENQCRLQRVQSTRTRDDREDDVDQRADAFIANFRRQLRYERQVSLELRYCRSRRE